MEEVNNNIPVNNASITSHVDPVGNVVKGKEYENTNPNPEDLEDRWLRWKCLNCQFVYEGTKPLHVCPKCGNSDPDKFDDAF